jgi:predicted transcriptional regulator
MLTIELEPDTQQLLDAIAQKEHRSPNEIIKQLINTYN